MQSKQIAFEGYTNEENFANRQRVSVFKSFYESSNLKSIYHYNAQNKRDGKAETYFDEKDKIAETLTFKDGQPEGNTSYTMKTEPLKVNVTLPKVKLKMANAHIFMITAF